MRLRGFASAVIALAVVLGANVGSATATTFCVPSFHAACPNSGGNVAKADVEEAMGLNSTDGIADQVIIAAGTFTENSTYEPEPATDSETFEPKGSDPLTVIGAGPAATVLTTPATGNVFIVNLSYNNSRAITIKDLTVRIPASLPDGLGSAFQLDGDVLDNVDIVSRNPDSGGIASAVGAGNVFRNGETRGESGGNLDDPMCACTMNGSLLVEDSTLTGATWALQASAVGAQLTTRRVRVVNAKNYGVIVTRGSATVENSVLGTVDGIGFYVSASADNGSIVANHITAVDTGSSSPAMEIQKTSGSGNASLTVSNSILRGFSSGYKVVAAAGPGIGVATLIGRYSNFPKAGVAAGVVDVATGNVDVDPKLLGNGSLPPSSPSVDAGDLAAGLTTDFLGALRPVDGNGDGIARRDQGAFEYQPPPRPVDECPVMAMCAFPPPADTTAPQTTIAKGPGKKLAKGKAKFSFASSEAGSRFECKLDGKKVTACKSPKRYSGLKSGRHTFKVWATDAAGNKDPTPAKRRFQVPAAD
jgi:hypothetical protein